MIGKDRVFIIAEIGVNHNGSVDFACELIDAAVDSGVDAVKFQTWLTERSVTKSTQKVAYQLVRDGDDETQFDMLQKLELTFDEFKDLKDYSDDQNVIFMSSTDDIECANFLNSLQDIFKIGSSELNDSPFLKCVAGFQKPVLLSTGMATLLEVEAAIRTLTESGLTKDNITVMHCHTSYPTIFEDVNLRAMKTMADDFDVNVGYSDHTLGSEIPIAAVAMGARVIEKHLTLDRNMVGPDHKASMEPHEFKNMVKAIRNIEKSLGSGVKEPTESERASMALIRKSIVARKHIVKGEVLSFENMIVKRPALGIAPTEWEKVIGTKAIKEFKADDFIVL